MIKTHAGGILCHKGNFYWCGEYRPEPGFVTKEGIYFYFSTDLYDWRYEGMSPNVTKRKQYETYEIAVVTSANGIEAIIRLFR